MDIKSGEYVRLARKQGINKIIEIDEDGVLELEEPIADEWGESTVYIYPKNIKDEILEHSFELPDLLNVGDFALLEDRNLPPEYIWQIITRDDGTYTINNFENPKIIYIVTKEQFDRERYIVGG